MMVDRPLKKNETIDNINKKIHAQDLKIIETEAVLTKMKINKK